MLGNVLVGGLDTKHECLGIYTMRGSKCGGYAKIVFTFIALRSLQLLADGKCGLYTGAQHFVPFQLVSNLRLL